MSGARTDPHAARSARTFKATGARGSNTDVPATAIVMLASASARMHRQEAERFLDELRERFARFGLELHPDKTRLFPFGRHAEQEWRAGRGPKPGTFDFLGFTHKRWENSSRKVHRASTDHAAVAAERVDVVVEERVVGRL